MTDDELDAIEAMVNREDLPDPLRAVNPDTARRMVAEIRRLRRSPWEIARRMGEGEESRDEHDGHSVAIRTVRGEGEAGAGGQTAR